MLYEVITVRRAGKQFDDHLRTSLDHFLQRGLERVGLDIAEQVASTGDIEQFAKVGIGAGAVERAQRSLVAAVHQENCRRIGAVIGRYYAMDRDNRWERVEP